MLISMPASWNSPRISRCSIPAGGPYTWLDSVDTSHESVQRFDAWLKSLPPFTRDIEEGEIEELFEAAGNGELRQSADADTPLKPISTDPDIYELRKRSLSEALRFYHGEPERYPSHLVKLHRHIKSDHPPQQDEIDHAVGRYRGTITG